jgi:hypothetical protein
VFTRYQVGSLDSQTLVMGYPVVSIAQRGAEGVIAIGQTATGVLVFAQGGIGVWTIAQGGVGAIFGIGQGMIGLVVIAQVGIGLFFFIGQGGGGLQALGQGVVGKRLREYGKEMSEEFDELLSFRGRRRSDPPG